MLHTCPDGIKAYGHERISSFDRDWISFDNTGELIWRHEAAGKALRCWGIQGDNQIKTFSREQEQFLQAHRDALRQ